MIGALLYLRLTSLKNLVFSRFKRLRQPKYLFGAIVGAGYFWLIFFRHLGKDARPANSAAMLPPGDALPDALSVAAIETASLLGAIGALLLLGVVMLIWLAPKDKPGLGFTEAEIAFLFPAPVTRRMLINFKLLSSQFSILFTSFFFSLISNRAGLASGNTLTHALGWWVILSMLNLHFTGANLTVSQLIERGVSTVRRRLMVLGIPALAIAATLVWVWRDLPAPTAGDVTGLDGFSGYLVTITETGVLGWVLWPFRLVIAPFLAADLRAFLWAFGPALLVVAAHYFWVLRMEVSFEDASLAFAEKRAAAIAQVQAGKYRFGAAPARARPVPFPLGDKVRPEFAFLWKNLLSTRSYFNVRVWAVAAAVILVGSRWLRGADDLGSSLRMVVVGFSLIGGIYILLLGPHLARQDLRHDLGNADILKTYPLRGWQVLLGELLTPTVILSALIWLAVLAAALVFIPDGNMAKTFTPALQATCALCVAAVVPTVVALQLLVLNGATLIFPAWFQTTRTATGGGIELMGQRLIFMIGNLLVILTALVPAAFAAGGLIFILQWLVGAPAAVALATIVVLAVLVGEVWCGLWWLGERFEKFDLSAELRP